LTEAVSQKEEEQDLYDEGFEILKQKLKRNKLKTACLSVVTVRFFEGKH
jgi:hypothetical protein